MLTRQRGDTIIEVLLAFAVFSMISITSMVVMGQGSNASQRALEITLVRQQLDSQAEALRAAQQAYTIASDGVETEWEKIALSGAANNSQHFASTTECPKDSSEVQRSFIMDPRTAAVIDTGTEWLEDINGTNPPPYAQVDFSGTPVSYGMWIERTHNAGTPGSYDFDVRACWYGAGLRVPLQLDTTVRLYAPGS